MVPEQPDPARMSAALRGTSGVSYAALCSARTGPLLTPEIATAPRAGYSFQDVLGHTDPCAAVAAYEIRVPALQ